MWPRPEQNHFTGSSSSPSLSQLGLWSIWLVRSKSMYINCLQKLGEKNQKIKWQLKVLWMQWAAEKDSWHSPTGIWYKLWFYNYIDKTTLFITLYCYQWFLTNLIYLVANYSFSHYTLIKEVKGNVSGRWLSLLHFFHRCIFEPSIQTQPSLLNTILVVLRWLQQRARASWSR